MKTISKLLWPLVCLSLLSTFTACSNDSSDGSSSTYYHEPGTLEMISTEAVANKTFTFETDSNRSARSVSRAADRAAGGVRIVFDEKGENGSIVDETGTLIGAFTYDGNTLTITGDDETTACLFRLLSGSYYLMDINRLINSTGDGFAGTWVWESGTTPVYFYDWYKLFDDDRAENPVGVTASFSYSNGLITFVRDSDGGKEYLIYDGKYAYWVEDRLLPQS